MSSDEESTIDVPVQVTEPPKERSFKNQWKFISDVRRTIDNCFNYQESRYGKFKTNRDRCVIRFYNTERELLESHLTMKHIGKTSGNPYVLCNMDPCEDVQITIRT